METILNEFGSVDEQAMTDQFENLCGSVARAQRLQHIWNNSYPGISASVWTRPTKVDVFRAKAKREGFAVEQIEAFLQL